MTTCGQCGFQYDAVPTADLAATLASFGARYRDALQSAPDAVLRRRPEPAVWSALEYTCHVRDVLLVQRDRTILALVEDRPSFARMYRDERVELAGYARENTADVAAQLAMAANLVATVYAGLSAEQLARRCVYNFPGPIERDVAWLGRHTVHEGEHHLRDVTSVIDQLMRTG